MRLFSLYVYIFIFVGAMYENERVLVLNTVYLAISAQYT